jgi:hypothetical protein
MEPGWAHGWIIAGGLALIGVVGFVILAWRDGRRAKREQSQTDH